MLTGDKLETAENIARSCQLFSKEMSIVSVSETDQSLIHKKFTEQKEIYKLSLMNQKNKGLIIEGDSLGLL